MSRKTRKQKIRAQEHKKTMLLKSLTNEVAAASPQIKIPSSSPTQRFPSSRQKSPRVIRTPEGAVDQSYFMSDMRKSLFLILAIIGLEIALYYGTMNSYLASILRF